MTKRLLIIPAKGHSSRIPKKNIKKFYGKPIIHYSIISAKKSKIFDTIHISTENTQVLKIAKRYNLSPNFMREKKFSYPKIGIFDVLKQDLLNFIKLGKKFDEVWCLFPCAPLLNFNDLKKLSQKIKKKKIKLPCISISKYPAPTQWAYKMDKKKRLYPIFKNLHLIQSQKLEQTYFDVGILSVFKSEHLLKNNNKNINKKLYGYELPWEKVVDIDDMEDWGKAKILFKINKLK